MNELHLGNAHIYFKTENRDAAEAYRQLQEICFQNGIELYFDGEAELRGNDDIIIDTYEI